MKRKKLLSVLLTATMLFSFVAGCGDKATKGSESQLGEGGVKEFTAFFAVPGSEIEDNNEIQQMIA